MSKKMTLERLMQELAQGLQVSLPCVLCGTLTFDRIVAAYDNDESASLAGLPHLAGVATIIPMCGDRHNDLGEDVLIEKLTAILRGTTQGFYPISELPISPN